MAENYDPDGGGIDVSILAPPPKAKPLPAFSPNLELILGAMRLWGHEPDPQLLARMLERAPWIEPHLEELYSCARKKPAKEMVFEEIVIVANSVKYVISIPADEVGYHHFAQGERV